MNICQRSFEGNQYLVDKLSLMVLPKTSHFAMLLYRMTWKMQSKELLEEGENFTEIPYSERAIIAYDLGAWFIAYLMIGAHLWLEEFCGEQ